MRERIIERIKQQTRLEGMSRRKVAHRANIDINALNNFLDNSSNTENSDDYTVDKLLKYLRTVTDKKVLVEILYKGEQNEIFEQD